MVKTRRNLNAALDAQASTLVSKYHLEGKRRSQRIASINVTTTKNSMAKNEIVGSKRRHQNNATGKTHIGHAKPCDPTKQLASKILTRRSTISIPTAEANSVETELRNVFHKEQEKNKQLKNDYLHLQQKYYALVARVKIEESRNNNLTEENNKLRQAAKTYSISHIMHDHNY